MKKDILVINGNCLSMQNNAQYDWIAVKNDMIVDVGYGEDYKKHLGKNQTLLDAKGATVLPGFIDSHFHVVQAAINSISVDLSQAKSFDDIGDLIVQASKTSPDKVVRGIRLDEQKLKENRMPDRTVLDLYCKDIPVFINSVEYQKSVLNTYALLYYKIPFTLEGIEFDENQVPTGIITHSANALLRENILRNIPNGKRLDAVKSFSKTLIEKGITTINAMEGGRLYSDKDADFIYEYGTQFPIDMVLFYQTMDILKVREMNLKRIGGCFYLDGTFRARTSALSFPYSDSPGNRGGLNYTQEELNEFVLDCYINKLQLALYTIGDRAIEQAITAHEYALNKTGNAGLRHRLEHVELPTAGHLRRAKELGLVFSMSPAYEYIWGGPDKLYKDRLGEHYQRTNPFREIIDEGVVVCGGSDCDVTPADPMLGIHAAVNHPVEKHRVELYEAIRMFTVNGAYAIFEEDKKGTLEIGKQADLVILDQDIFKTEREKIKDIGVKATIKRGELLWSAYNIK
ncbi:amidohydrolase [Sinanaerobacter chloroacetimidivorans]|uniref:Amidohydrolase n=1 Tax=Sinanaerobacter chloroacetimidivorans TaxID=2818044 RepID=A0A8J7W4I6_9FIRM|nr:amidohydrolase [Sinanaerobacter chloroacetimidivorans]MBR0599218.1 amidohydrolase [Sinanaerobacter chloroacetimidivorans]